MTFFARHSGRHVRRGSLTGWAGTAVAVAAAAEHRVVNAAITRPALTRRPHETQRSAA